MEGSAPAMMEVDSLMTTLNQMNPAGTQASHINRPSLTTKVAPRYVPSGVRVMAYFRLQLQAPMESRSSEETCEEARAEGLGAGN